MIKTLEELRQRQSDGGRKRWKGTTKKDRREIMREVARKRYEKKAKNPPKSKPFT